MKQLLGAVLVFLCAAAFSYAQPPAPPAKAAPPAPAAGYVGDDTCVACHESEGKRLSATLHGKSQNPRTPAANVNQACETCHGPGGSTRDRRQGQDRVFTTMKPRDVSEVCVGCHNDRRTRCGRQHPRRAQPSCITCHRYSPK
jgi:hypothetical protein